MRYSRAIGVYALTGEAAGTTAVLSVKEGISLNDLDIGNLQDKLKKQNAVIDESLVLTPKTAVM